MESFAEANDSTKGGKGGTEAPHSEVTTSATIDTGLSPSVRLYLPIRVVRVAGFEPTTSGLSEASALPD